MFVFKFNKHPITKKYSGFTFIGSVIAYGIFLTFGFSHNVANLVMMTIILVYSLRVNNRMRGSLREILINEETIRFEYQNRLKDAKTVNRNEIDIEFAPDDRISFYHRQTKNNLANIQKKLIADPGQWERIVYILTENSSG